MKNKLLVISGPSGVGKGTLVKALKALILSLPLKSFSVFRL